MVDNENLIEPLFEKAKDYTETSCELLKLKALNKTTDLASGLVSSVILVIVICLFAVTVSVGISLWLGEVLGKTYYGFFIVGGFYLLAAVIVFFIHPWIKNRIGGLIITHTLN